MLSLLVASAFATTLPRPLAIDELAARSDAAVLGEVVEVEAVRRDGRIWTVIAVDAEAGEDAEVWIPGGCLAEEDLCLTVLGAPRAAVGDRVFVFLDGDRVTGLAQGLFAVKGSQAWRDVAGLAFASGGADVPTRVPLQDLVDAAGSLLDE